MRLETNVILLIFVEGQERKHAGSGFILLLLLSWLLLLRLLMLQWPLLLLMLLLPRVVGGGNLFEVFSAVTIVLIHVESELYFFFGLSWRRTETSGTANFSLESGSMDLGIMTGVRADDDVGVGRFTVDLGGHAAVSLPRDKDVEEGNLAIYFRFSCELHTVVHSIEAIVECLCRVNIIVAAAKARSSGLLCLDAAPAVIHIDHKVLRDWDFIFGGLLYCCLQCVDHPHLRHSNHE